jgi:hypothetical protein
VRPDNASPAKARSHGGHPRGSPGDRVMVVRDVRTEATEAVVSEPCLFGLELSLVLRIQPMESCFDQEVEVKRRFAED